MIPLTVLFAIVCWSIGVMTSLLGMVLSVCYFFRNPQKLEPLPAVSILKPVKGAEPGFEENLRSFFLLDYPEYEILISVADEDDPACFITRKLLSEFPRVNARLIVGFLWIGPNPKVNNLILPYKEARFETILISDSNVRVDPAYLKKLVRHLKPNVGIVTAAVRGTGAEGFGAFLEAAYLNGFYARWMLLCHAFGHPCVVGKSMLFRRETMEKLGGIWALRNYIAEDYQAGLAVKALGMKIAIAKDPISQHLGPHSVAEFWKRHIRWGRIRKAQVPVAFVIEILFGSLVSGLLGAMAFREIYSVGVGIFEFLLLHLGFCFLCDLILAFALGVKFKLESAFAWLFMEILALPLWIHISLGNGIIWRGTRLKIRPGGVLA